MGKHRSSGRAGANIEDNKKLQQTTKNTFGPGTHFPDDKFVLMTRKWNTTIWNFNQAGNVHYSDVIMSAMASQITGVLIVCLNVCSVADQRKHQSSMSLAFVRGIHRWQVNSPHKGPVTRKMFPFDDVIVEWKSSDEMGPRTLRQPNLRKVDLPYGGKAEMKAL